MILSLMLSAAAVSPSMPATDAASRGAITAHIEQCAMIWAMMMVKPDPEALRPCLADDYAGVTSRGKVVDKATMLTPPPTPGKAGGLYYAKPRFVTPTLAVVRGEEWLERATGEKIHLIWTDTWLLRDGKWQVVASQDSLVPFDQPLQN